ncbi:hypothetical protein NXX23_17385 [Bacteroides ovatus]|nr:hypothetical protein [Bacteroides ovatus]
MSIVCSICGGTGVKCTAVIDPNTRQFLEFTRNALSDYGAASAATLP